MSTTHRIVGVVAYQEIGPGFWGIIDADGRKWRPASMPKKWQKEGLRAVFEIREIEEEVSIFMWGTPVIILSGEEE